MFSMWCLSLRAMMCACISLCGIIKEWGASNLQSENYYKRAT